MTDPIIWAGEALLCGSPAASYGFQRGIGGKLERGYNESSTHDAYAK
ncbi:hypothetical protein I3J27_22145 [Bradyrhizobium xenonodulans]|uniref:Uncharacterized protein n=1 Tax=Bradyrhizobium xenonodulans TaxID=2736875 RepID=A0ABY7MBP0_9BRAD|nr:hypothetical protein [Bradyrhizobium xenonodulans]WBL75735.1 hypothetical protein I3J27_22145 [Bradyrhizobium xenonodulans]